MEISLLRRQAELFGMLRLRQTFEHAFRLLDPLLKRVVARQEVVVLPLGSGDLFGQLGDLALFVERAHRRTFESAAGDRAVGPENLASERHQSEARSTVLRQVASGDEI